MNKVLQLDLTLLTWLLGYAEYGDAIIIGALCAAFGVVITAFCIMTEPDVIPAELLEAGDE